MPTERERHPAPLELDARARPRAGSRRGAGARASAAPRRRARGARPRESRRPARRRRLDAVERAAPSRHAPRRRARGRRATIVVDAAHASIRSTGTSRIDDAARGLEPREQPPDVGGGDERVHRDHARLGERDDARRARAGDELADLLERGLRRVEHQVARLARLDDAARIGREPRARSSAPRRRSSTASEAKSAPERAEAVRAQRVPARDEVDDRVGEAEPRRDLDRAGDVDELDRDVRVRREGARSSCG